MPSLIVRELDVMTDGVWSFGQDRPQWRHSRHGGSGSFDPFPAYPHDVAVIEETAKAAASICPPLWDVELFVANREEIGRSNGFSNVHAGGHYEGDEWVKDPPLGLIMLSGKRIPPHPALSRYLVAHEYGHNVEWMLEHLAGTKHLHTDTVVTEYAKLRGLPTPIHHGNGGRWHDSATEVFACDFRILVCDIETEFWPHLGVPRPEHVEADLPNWWADALGRLAKRLAEQAETST